MRLKRAIPNLPIEEKLAVLAWAKDLNREKGEEIFRVSQGGQESYLQKEELAHKCRAHITIKKIF